MLDVALLGTSGMMPLPDRFLTSMLCRNNGRLLLVDCGEGTQVTNKILGWGFKNIDIMCITHVHGDHVTGIPGMLLTMANSYRVEPLTILGPKGIKDVVYSLLVVARDLPFDINYIEFEENQEIHQCGDYTIHAIKADHRVLCYGYKIEIKRVGKFNKQKAIDNNVPKELWGRLQNKEKIEYKDRLLTYNDVMGEDRKSINLSYITDTRPFEGMADFVKDSDLFICEGIYGDNEKIDRAIEHKHMTFLEAAEVAKNANVNELWLTHFSPALTEPEAYLDGARDIFPNTFVGEDRKNILLKFIN